MTEVHREIMAKYRVDGIFINRWSGSGMCYCEHCRDELQGGVRPRPAPVERSASIRSAAGSSSGSRSASSRSGGSGMRRFARSIADSCVIPNTGGGATSPLDMKIIGELAPILFADRQGRSGLAAPWANGKNAKEYRATMGRKPIGGIFSVGVEEAYRWKDSVQSPAEIRIWVADGIANGLQPWFTKFSGTLYDRRWLGVVEEIYRWHHRVEDYLRNEAPLARVGLVYSQQTALVPRRSETGTSRRGPYPGLVPGARSRRGSRSRWCTTGCSTRSTWTRFKTLILPGVAALSDEQCQQLSRLCRSGRQPRGDLRDLALRPVGSPRKDFGLADLFGVSYRGHAPGPMRNSYLGLEDDPRTNRRHPDPRWARRNASRIINGTYRLEVEARRPLGQPPLTLIPSYPDLPMEKVYPRDAKTEIPQVFLRETRRRARRLLPLGHRSRLLGAARAPTTGC